LVHAKDGDRPEDFYRDDVIRFAQFAVMPDQLWSTWMSKLSDWFVVVSLKEKLWLRPDWVRNCSIAQGSTIDSRGNRIPHRLKAIASGLQQLELLPIPQIFSDPIETVPF
jgi:hypothetical protein